MGNNLLLALCKRRIMFHTQGLVEKLTHGCDSPTVTKDGLFKNLTIESYNDFNGLQQG